MATIHDVALEAGLSPTTISRYVNRRITLPASTCARIDAAINKLDYRPNLLARRLSTGRSEAIGLVAPDIRDPLFAELAAAVEDEAHRHGYAVVISATGEDRQREIAAIDRLHDRHVDGLILMSRRRNDRTLSELIARKGHVVLVNEDVLGVDAPRVFAANERGASEAVRRLIKAGHREIAFIGGQPGLLTTEERRSGYLRALHRAGIEIREDLILLRGHEPAFARRAVGALLDLPRPPTAIFAAGEELLMGTVLALRDAGLSIPVDMSVTGFGDLPALEMLQPPITVVRQPVDALGRQSFLTLLALLRGERPPALTRIPVTLIRRGSVAPPSRRAPLAALVSAGA